MGLFLLFSAFAVVRISGIIPARYASSRFPGKALADIGGKSMIQRVYGRACRAESLAGVVVATDDGRIEKEVKRFGGRAVMTSPNHRSGTDRCAEAVKKMKGEWDALINIQGDEPYIHPEQIDAVAALLSGPGVQIATLVKRIETVDELHDRNTPKAVLNENHEVVDFSREPIPVIEGVDEREWLRHGKYYKHIGIYGYRADVLQEITRLEQTPRELEERLEQLRWLDNGFRIKAGITALESVSVDTPEDLEKMLKSKQQ